MCLTETTQDRTSAAGHAGSGVPIEVAYRPRKGLLRLSIANFLLNLVTLSIYRFWAKTRVRRHIWSSIRVNGEPLEYTGTGGELFRGALIVFLVLILPTVLLFLALTAFLGPQHPLIAAAQFIVFMLFLLLTGMAIYRARRYRLSRTHWRGIRGTLVGSPWKYSLLYFGSLLLRALTLGWSTPAMNLELQQRITREMRFGETPFSFRGRAGPLYPTYALCWFGVLGAIVLFLAIAGIEAQYLSGDVVDKFLKMIGSPDSEPPTGDATPADQWQGTLKLAGIVVFAILGIFVCAAILWTLYQAREMSLFAAYTGFDGASCRLEVTTGSLLALWLGNIAIIVLTIGIAAPVAAQRNAKYLCDRLSFDGAVDIERIVQSRAPVDKRGEGLADAFGIDAF